MDLDSTKRRKFNPSNTFSSTLNSTSNPNTTKQNIYFAGKTIETTVTSDPDSITEWITETLSLHKDKKVIVGLDVEWKPNCSKYTNNKAATLQLCINTKCLIIQLFYLNTIPQTLKDFLSSKLHNDTTFVGVEVESDAAKLKRDYGLKCGKMRDLYKSVGLSRQRIGLKKLAWEVVGLVMSKPKYVTMSDWEARVLSEAQVEYACIDAYASYRIANILKV